ncbi:hypothetical protein Hanom_Chr09g00852091 [Helianthus anomalus]
MDDTQRKGQKPTACCGGQPPHSATGARRLPCSHVSLSSQIRAKNPKRKSEKRRDGESRPPHMTTKRQ